MPPPVVCKTRKRGRVERADPGEHFPSTEVQCATSKCTRHAAAFDREMDYAICFNVFSNDRHSIITTQFTLSFENETDTKC